MAAFRALDAQAMIVKLLVMHLGEALIVFQRTKGPAVELLNASFDRPADLLLQTTDFVAEQLHLLDGLSNWAAGNDIRCFKPPWTRSPIS